MADKPIFQNHLNWLVKTGTDVDPSWDRSRRIYLSETVNFSVSLPTTQEELCSAEYILILLVSSVQ